ncbi:ABC transporter substrate-binding protein [Tessaracoccus rhinocerotis]|nr:ABC transporter substrate-binding protein [Tessaracoccus rhinocerotis]
MAAALVACSGGTEAGNAPSPDATGDPGAGATADTGGSKGVLRLAMNQDIQGWDIGNQPGYMGWPAEAVWDTLFKCDAFNELEPDIAESWEINEDRSGVTAHIREGMEFSDGTPVDSAAVEASFTYIKETSSRAADYASLVIETPDAYTVSLTWDEPQVTLEDKVCAPKITTPALIESGNTNDEPIGSGPYVLDAAKTTRGSVYAFAKNENHWNADHYPYEELLVSVIESETATVSALKTGQLDGARVTAPSVAEVEASGLNTKQYRAQVPRLILSDRTGEKIPALGDVRVRQAINMVFDKETVAQALYLGHAEPTAQVFRPGSRAHIEGLEDPYPFDVEKARELMAEAGYADGFSIELPTMTGQNHETVLPYITQQLAEINITVEQVPLSGANAIGDLLSGTYPVVFWELGNIGDSAMQIYIEATPDGWWNLQHQPNEYVDSRFEQMASADEATSEKLQQEINQYIVDEAWFAPLVYAGGFWAFTDDVQIPTDSFVEGLHPALRDFK